MQKKFNLLIVFLLISLNSCGIYKYTDQRNQPSSGLEKARKNIEEGKGVGIKGLIRGGKTTYEFSTSNTMWRASLELLDFIPLTTVDYSGGLIITDWYSDSNNFSNESIKITLRFLSNEISSNSLKIIVHQKKCKALNDCDINEINTKIKDELINRILALASSIEKKNKAKK